MQNFVDATYRGYAYARDNQQEATDIMLRHFPVLDRAVTAQQLAEISELITGPASLGWMGPEKVNNTLEFLFSKLGAKHLAKLHPFITRNIKSKFASNGSTHTINTYLREYSLEALFDRPIKLFSLRYSH